MPPSDFSVALAGSVSSAFSTVSVYPLDTIKTHLNKGLDPEGKPIHSVDDVLQRVVFRDGYSVRNLFSLYAGVRAKMLMSMLQKFLYFYIYNFLKTRVARGKSLSIISNLVVGYISALLAVGVLTPLEVAQTQQQLNPQNKRSITQILSQLYHTEGLAGFYKGFGTNVILCVNPSIEYTVFDQMKKSMLTKKMKTNLSDTEAFWLGAFAKAVATVLTFPHVRAKVLQQSGLAKWKHMDSSSILAKLLVTEGFTSLFAGMKTQLVKNVIASAIMLSLKERIERTVIERTSIKSS